MHYGTEFRIEVLDASTDASVGSTLVTSQGLLQWQRDQLASEGGLTLSSIISQEPIHVKKRKTILELRTGVKSGFGLDFYKAEKLSGSTRAGKFNRMLKPLYLQYFYFDLIYFFSQVKLVGG
jgi:hypothetical protein